MNIKLEQELYTKYPSMFSNTNKDIQESCMAFGIECGDGWYDLLNVMCSRISSYQAHNKNCNVVFDQIKEKWAGLRVYYSGGDSYISGVISAICDMSYITCEVCGNRGVPRKTGWIRTLCDKHLKEIEDKL